MNNLKSLVDCHTHTRFSVDCDANERDMIERAISLGLTAYAVTDHCEANRWYPKEHYGDLQVYPYFDFKNAFESSVSRITELRDEYKDRITLIVGSELGEAQECPDEAEIVVKDERVDFIIGSLHQLPGEEDFALIDYTGYTTDEVYLLLDKYFSEMLKLCKWGKFDVLGHLTYFLRYMNGKYDLRVDISRYDELIAECLREVASKGKGLEINTSGLRQNYGETFPTVKYVKMFKDLGGEIVSLGSDTHYVQHVGADIDKGAAVAAEAGFDRIAFYIKHSPEFVKL